MNYLKLKKIQVYDWGSSYLEIGDFVFAKFNGINWVSEHILDDISINSHPPSKDSDKPQLSGWCNKKGGFEDYYEKSSIKIEDLKTIS